MYTDCVASSSRLPIQDNWDSPLSLWSFPVSDCRYESSLPDTHPSSASATPQQSPAKSSPQPLASTPTPLYSTNLPVRRQLSPGVYTDGKNTVYSSALPEVQQLLATARSSLALPNASSDLIFTLAALEVFYKPGDPVHWLFWSDEKKSATADIVTRISLHRPPLITSPVAWNGKPEYLSILASHHGTTWRSIYESKSWFTIVVPPKPSTPPRQLNLRKRRVAPGAFRDPSRTPELEDNDGDEMGRASTSRAPSPEPIEEAAPKAKINKRQARARVSRVKPKPPSLSPLSSPTNSPEVAILTLSPEQNPTGLSADADAAMGETAARSKRKISPPSRYPQPVSFNQDAPPTLETSLLLGPAVHPGQLLDSAGPGHSRTRSTSTDSSGKTAVASDVSRSASVASGTTAVDAGDSVPPSKKRKALDDDGAELEGLNGDSLDLADADEEGEGDDESAVTALGRTKRSRKATSNSSFDDAVSEKTKVVGSGFTGRTNRKRARKA